MNEKRKFYEDNCSTYRLDIEEQHLAVEGWNVGEIRVKSPINTEISNDESPDCTRGEDFTPWHFRELENETSHIIDRET